MFLGQININDNEIRLDALKHRKYRRTHPIIINTYAATSNGNFFTPKSSKASISFHLSPTSSIFQTVQNFIA